MASGSYKAMRLGTCDLEMLITIGSQSYFEPYSPIWNLMQEQNILVIVYCTYLLAILSVFRTHTYKIGGGGDWNINNT